MIELITWLREQLDEDERIARESDLAQHRAIVTEVLGRGKIGTHRQARHIATWEPGRALAEVAAKRAILDEHEMWARYQDDDHERAVTAADSAAALLVAIRMLAQPYADRPGWREEWRQ